MCDAMDAVIPRFMKSFDQVFLEWYRCYCSVVPVPVATEAMQSERKNGPDRIWDFRRSRKRSLAVSYISYFLHLFPRLVPCPPFPLRPLPFKSPPVLSFSDPVPGARVRHTSPATVHGRGLRRTTIRLVAVPSCHELDLASIQSFFSDSIFGFRRRPADFTAEPRPCRCSLHCRAGERLAWVPNTTSKRCC